MNSATISIALNGPTGAESTIGLLPGVPSENSENSDKRKPSYGSVAPLLDEKQEDSKSDVSCCSNESAERSHKQHDKTATYSELIRSNRTYRLLFAGWILEEAGEWFSYMAALALIESILGEPENDRTVVSILVAVWLIPDVLFVGVGGLLADSRDRRKTMMELDCLGATVALAYLVAVQYQAISLVYVVSFLKQMIAALYEPAGTAILPMVVPNEEYLKKATTLYEFASSIMATAGPALGGVGVAVLGIRACFVIDSLMYAVSAFLTWKVGGSWNPGDDNNGDNEDEDEECLTFWEKVKGMTVDAVVYLRSSFFGALVLLQFSAAWVYGAIDVLEVSFSERGRGGEAANSTRLGILFAFSGVGCLLGTVAAEYCTNMKDPRSLQRACVWSYLCMAMAYLGMGIFPAFAGPCIFTIVNSASSTLLCIASDLMLQIFCAPKILGRVMAVEWAMATLSEALSAILAGVIQDAAGLSAQQVSLLVSAVGVLFFVLWLVYDECGCGAASEAAKRHKSHYAKALENAAPDGIL